MRMIACTMVLVLSLVIAGNVFADDQDKVSASDVKKQAEQTLEAVKKFTVQHKELYQKKAEEELRDLSERIGELRKKSRTVRSEAMEKLDSQFKDLKDKQTAAEKKLGELRSSTEQAWDDAKKGLENAVGTLKRSYENVLKSFE